MFKPYTFYINNVRYVTILGLEIDEYLANTAVAEYHNVVPWSVVKDSKYPCDKALQKQTDVDLYDAPVVTVTEHSVSDGVWTVKGTVNGEDFLLTDSELYVGRYMLYPAVRQLDDSVPEAPEVVEEEAQPVPVSVSKSKSEVESKLIGIEGKVKGFRLGERVQEPKGSGWSLGSNGVSRAFTMHGTMPPSRRESVKAEPVVAEPVARREFRQPQPQGGSAYKPPVTQKLNKPNPAPAKEPEPETGLTEDELNDLLSVVPTAESVPEPEAQAPADNPAERWSRISSVTTEDEVKEAPKTPVNQSIVSKEAKDAFRAELSPEVNKIIGDIPHSCLGPIEEFTMQGVDADKLETDGVVYCVDNRWHKCGNWFCIDVVSDAARYFYNNKIGVSLQIPTATCKKWLSLIGGGTE